MSLSLVITPCSSLLTGIRYGGWVEGKLQAVTLGKYKRKSVVSILKHKIDPENPILEFA